MNILNIEHIHKIFGDKVIFDDISCGIDQGEKIGIIGVNGTGKTTFLRKLKQESPKRMVVVAPTGIAAINAGGVTIHSFFQIPFAPYVPESSFSTNGKASYRFRFGKEKINIIRSMDLLVTAFENQLDKLFQSDALDVSADVAALEGMLNMDGLTGNEFTK